MVANGQRDARRSRQLRLRHREARLVQLHRRDRRAELSRHRRLPPRCGGRVPVLGDGTHEVEPRRLQRHRHHERDRVGRRHAEVERVVGAVQQHVLAGRVQQTTHLHEGALGPVPARGGEKERQGSLRCAQRVRGRCCCRHRTVGGLEESLVLRVLEREREVGRRALRTEVPKRNDVIRARRHLQREARAVAGSVGGGEREARGGERLRRNARHLAAGAVQRETTWERRLDRALRKHGRFRVHENALDARVNSHGIRVQLHLLGRRQHAHRELQVGEHQLSSLRGGDGHSVGEEGIGDEGVGDGELLIRREREILGPKNCRVGSEREGVREEAGIRSAEETQRVNEGSHANRGVVEVHLSTLKHGVQRPRILAVPVHNAIGIIALGRGHHRLVGNNVAVAVVFRWVVKKENSGKRKGIRSRVRRKVHFHTQRI